MHGLEANDNVLVRTQIINEEGHKTVLSREESLDQIKRMVNLLLKVLIFM